LAVSPNYAADQIIFAGTGGGVFKSTDGGVSWSSASTGMTNNYIESFVISPNYAGDQTIFAGTNGGVFKTTDGGVNWNAVNTGITGAIITSLAISPNYAGDQNIFAGAWIGGVFKTTDGGANWNAVNTGITNTTILSLAVSPNYAGDQTIFAGTNGGVFKTNDGGVNWNAVNTGITSTIIQSLAVSPNFSSDQTIFAGTAGGVFKTTDGGANWNAVNTGITSVSILSLAVSPNYAGDQTIFAGTNGGVFKTTDGGVNWNAVNTGITSTIIQSLAVSPNFSSDQTIFAGTAGGVFGYTFFDNTPPATTLGANPTGPDGDNGWYKSNPIIILTPDESAATYYQWDTTSTPGWNEYLGPIDGLLGNHQLNFFSIDDYNNTETVKSQVFDVKVDGTAPIDPATIISPVPTGIWQRNNVININFAGATDTVSGIDGYSVSWSQNSIQTPDANMDLQETATSTVSPTLADGVWWFNLRTKDNAGNWTATKHHGPFWVDYVPPTATINLPTIDGRNADFTWQAVNIGGSPVSGCSYYLDGYDDAWSSWSGLNSASYSNLPNGNYSLKVKVKDLAGNESSVVSYPFSVNVPDTVAFDAFLSWDSGPGSWDRAAGKVAVGDFNGDGYDDVVAFYGYKSTRQTRAFVWLNDQWGGFNEPVVWWDSGPGNWDWAGTKLVVGDYNGDNQDDLVVFYGYASQRQTRALVFTASGSTFSSPDIWWDSGPGNWDWAGTKLQVGDYNGDNKDDLVGFYGYASERQTRAFVFTASGFDGFKAPTVWWDSGPGNWDWAGTKLSSGDFNGDGQDDLLAFYGYKAEHQTRAWVFSSGGSSFNSAVVWWDSGLGNWDWNGSKVVVGDFAGSTQDDIAVLYSYTGYQSKLWGLTSNSSSFNNPYVMWDSGPDSWDWTSTDMLAGDFWSDGFDEPLAFYGLPGYESAIVMFDLP